MRKLSLLLLAALTLTGASPHSSTSPHGALLEIVTTDIDLGTIRSADGIRTVRIDVHNTGDATLNIRFIGSTCGCTRVELGTTRIPPSENGAIHLSVNPTTSKSGMNVQDLFFETNVHEQEQLQLTVRYRVILDDVTISPATMLVRLSSQQLQQSQNTVLNKILIQDNWDRRLEITDIKSSSGVAVGMYDMVYRCPKGSTVHIFWLTPVLSDSLPIGPFREEIVLTTNHPRFQRVVIPIQGEVTDDRVQVAPTALLFRDTNDRSVRNIRVRAPADAGELVLSGVGSDIEHLRTEIKRIDAQTVDVVVTWPEGVRHSTHVTEGVRKGTIRIGVQGPVTTEKTINVVLLTPAPTTTRAAP